MTNSRPWSDRGQAVSIGGVVAERLLDEDGNVVLERPSSTSAGVAIGVTTTTASRPVRLPTSGTTVSLRLRVPGPGCFGSRDDVDVASERAEVAQDVSAPMSTSDLTHDHRRRS
jgi:hypothetical protein